MADAIVILSGERKRGGSAVKARISKDATDILWPYFWIIKDDRGTHLDHGVTQTRRGAERAVARSFKRKKWELNEEWEVDVDGSDRR